MKLNKLLERLDYEVVQGSDEIEITTLINDSRKVENGSAFVCISGAVSDGHKFIPDVAAKGAAAVIVEREAEAPENVTVLGGKTGTTSKAGSCLALVSQNAYGEPFISIVVNAANKTDLYYDMNTLLSQIY